MATQIAYSKGCPWKTVVRAQVGRVVLRALQVGAPNEVTTLDRLFEWLKDSDRRGHYAYQYEAGVDPDSYEPIVANLRFYFDDAETAFEFKIRWG